jgi:hypothetical protein
MTHLRHWLCTAALVLPARAQQPEHMRRLGVIVNFAADDPETHWRSLSIALSFGSVRLTGRTAGILTFENAIEMRRAVAFA